MPTLHWIGKEKVINHHRDVPFHVLNEQYTFNTEGGTNDGVTQSHPVITPSENKIIHGDNLLALKSLLPQYEGKIKCIYIDPPYNTGNEGWVYNDNVNDPKIKKWLAQTVGKEGEDLSRHDKWLCMMYPRLKLLHQLLAKDGVIFISIDENEMSNFMLMCSEVFGHTNYIATITVIVKPEGRRYGFFAKTHEYIIVFSKNYELVNLNEIEVEGSKYTYFDEKGGFNLKGLRNRNVKSFNSTNRPNLRYPFYVNVNNPDANNLFEVSVQPQEGWQEVMASTVDGLQSVWRWGKEKSEKQKYDLCAYVGSDSNIRIFQKERKLTQTAKTTWDDKNFHSIKGTRELTELLGKSIFDFPKPEMLIRQILAIGTNEDDIILDSYAGSGTTAHAVLNLNKQDGGNRKFILIEMEDYAETITAERVKRVIKGYGNTEGVGGDFTYHTLGASLFDEDGNLNEAVGKEKIKEYVYYTETEQYIADSTKIDGIIDGVTSSHPVNDNDTVNDNPYLMGKKDTTAYYFYYEPTQLTTLDMAFLGTIRTQADMYIIYADNVLLSADFMKSRNIIFKKIPRDVRRF
jgi:adenine-specific DNA-methyltransferase